jgi:transcription elongation GreA/GreB family factor
MKDDGYTLRSLMLWAKEDNPEEYKVFIKEDFENNLKKNSVSNTFMIAKALYSKYFDKFVCANVGGFVNELTKQAIKSPQCGLS